MNDTWVFDPQKVKWFQRHPEGAPEPHAKHQISAKNGVVSITGGYMYGSRGGQRYFHVGPEVWIYDIGKDVWKGPKGARAWPHHSRRYHGGDEHPSHFLRGKKPNAAEHEKRLANLPVNEWISLKPPYLPAGSRAWGTMAHDTDHDLIVHWNGGHSSYCSSDAPHYHVGTNRWELAYPAEIQLGVVGASASALAGYSYNKRHWITNHTWNHYGYDPHLKRVVVASGMALRGHWMDLYTHIYDPVLGEWETRFKKPNSIGLWCSLVRTPLGTLAHAGNGEWWRLDPGKPAWQLFAKLGKKWPNKACSDWYFHVYDGSANRILAVQTGYGMRPWNGSSLFAFDLTTKGASVIKPENPELLGPMRYGREWRYLPDLKITVIGATRLKKEKVRGKEDWVLIRKGLIAYDPVKNRWMILKVKGYHGMTVSGSLQYDEKRRILFAIGSRGHVKALKLDLERAME
jgi:hypothetical protein